MFPLSQVFVWDGILRLARELFLLKFSDSVTDNIYKWRDRANFVRDAHHPYAPGHGILRRPGTSVSVHRPFLFARGYTCNGSPALALLLDLRRPMG
ncbi:MAG: hypothetical protein KatS3mg110_0175 [Pirellulaceae bacterium]|nr:MAG: hypothetical protein KatS3mg110_0175 [Pirellulaceae bacterium]